MKAALRLGQNKGSVSLKEEMQQAAKRLQVASGCAPRRGWHLPPFSSLISSLLLPHEAPVLFREVSSLIFRCCRPLDTENVPPQPLLPRVSAHRHVSLGSRRSLAPLSSAGSACLARLCQSMAGEPDLTLCPPCPLPLTVFVDGMRSTPREPLRPSPSGLAVQSHLQGLSGWATSPTLERMPCCS